MRPSVAPADPGDDPDVVHTDPLVDLVETYLLERTRDLSAPQTAAFVAGWTSALELLHRTDLTLPGAPPAIVRAIATLIERISAAQVAALDDPEDTGPGPRE